jgi:hypothetical protein
MIGVFVGRTWEVGESITIEVRRAEKQSQIIKLVELQVWLFALFSLFSVLSTASSSPSHPLMFSTNTHFDPSRFPYSVNVWKEHVIWI